jgi:hypothetical protein
MAGILGIIKKQNSSLDSNELANALHSMLPKLYSVALQKKEIIALEKCCFGNVAPVSDKTNNSFFYNNELGIYCIIDGLIFIEDSEKRLVQESYNLTTNLNDIEYIPYLYVHYKADYVKHVGGWFNIFLYDVKNETSLLSNDRLGLLPLYYYESDTVFIFASKIEGILASGLMPKIEFDVVSMAENLLFNYPVSANTFIKSISTLPAAVQYTFSVTLNKIVYWSPAELISSTPLSKSKSLDLIDESLSHAINKPFKNNNGLVGATLTGGWDGRLVLAYMLPEYKDRLRVFSFGSEFSPDVTIPMEISGKESFSYTPFILNQEYINNSFLDSAGKTILYSNGMRSYRRSHYIYAAQQLVPTTGIFVSGNFGDEVFKFSQILPCEVITKELISLVQSGFTKRTELISENNSSNSAFFNDSGIKDELFARLDQLEKEVAVYSTISEKFHHLKLTRIAAKYFGAEINSYNDFISNFSPFLDFDFLTAFSQTSFSGIYYPFNGNKLKHKEMSSMLYAELIKRNSKSLLNYNTDRGFSMADMMHPLGKLSVLYKKKFRKKHSVNDPYFLDQTDRLFQTFCESDSLNEVVSISGLEQMLTTESVYSKQNDKVLTMKFWINHIAKEYSL